MAKNDAEHNLKNNRRYKHKFVGKFWKSGGDIRNHIYEALANRTSVPIISNS